MEVEEEDECSMLNLYKSLSSLLADSVALQYSGYELLRNSTSTLAYRRYHSSSTDEFLVVINFSNKPISPRFKAVLNYPAVVLSSVCSHNHTGTSIDLRSLTLQAEEALVIKGKSESVCK